MSVLGNLLGAPSVYVSDSEGWLVDWLSGTKSDAGIRVTPTSAMALSAYFACLRNIAEDLGKLPLFVYERMEPRGKRRMPEHRVYKLVHDEPNPTMTAMALRETMTGHAMGWGGGFAEIQRDGGGRPLWLNGPIHPSRIKIVREYDANRKTNRLVYHIRSDDIITKDIAIPQADMIHLHGFGGDGCSGYALSVLAKNAIGLGLATEKFGSRFFAHGTHMSGVLQHPGELSPEAQDHLRESWIKLYGGTENALKPAILEEGMEWKSMGIPPEEAQFLQTRHLQVEEICRAFRMPPHKIQHLLRATFSNISHQAIEYVSDTLMPWAVRWEQELKRKLLPDEPTLFVEHLFAGLLRGDPRERAEFYAKRFLTGSLSPNDIREYENENSTGPAGDVYFVQGQMVPVESLVGSGVGGENSVDAPGAEVERRNRSLIRQAHLPLFEDAMLRVVTKATKATERAAKRFGNDAGEFGAWLDKFFAEHRSYVVSVLTSPALAYAALLTDGREVESIIAQTVSEYAGLHINSEKTVIQLAYDMPLGIAGAWVPHRPGGLPASAAAIILDRIEGVLKDATAKDK